MIRSLMLVAGVVLSGCVTPPTPFAAPRVPCAEASGPAAEACGVLTTQVAAWNAGNIPGFMAGYWNDPDLTFASGGTVTLGWQPTLARYLARYDTPAKMGRLSFNETTVRLLSRDRAVVLGRWQLDREADAPWGLFTVVLARLPEGWRVIHDHTSSAD
jgi:hypothetical protein